MNGEAIAALSLINSVHIEEQDFMNILSQCRATLTDSNRNDEIVDNNQPEPSSGIVRYGIQNISINLFSF